MDWTLDKLRQLYDDAPQEVYRLVYRPGTHEVIADRSKYVTERQIDSVRVPPKDPCGASKHARLSPAWWDALCRSPLGVQETASIYRVSGRILAYQRRKRRLEKV